MSHCLPTNICNSFFLNKTTRNNTDSFSCPEEFWKVSFLKVDCRTPASFFDLFKHFPVSDGGGREINFLDDQTTIEC